MFATNLRPPHWFVRWLLNKAEASAHKKSSIFGPDGSLYMERKPLTKFNWVRIHVTYRSDIDIHLHDHPWWNVSWVLLNGYVERLPYQQAQPSWYDMVGAVQDTARKPGALVFRRATDRHRLLLNLDPATMAELPSISLFITGPKKVRDWGFHTENGWVHWRTYLRSRA